MSETVTPLVQHRAAPAGWPRAAVTAVFFVHGLLFASWTAHIPHVKAHLRLGDGALGIALLGAPAGSVLAMLAAAYFLPRFGSRRVIRVALAGYCTAGPIVGLTGSFAMLFAALTVWGAFQGILDVSMNTQAISVERLACRPLMSGFHGLWSIGSFAGAALGALGIAIGLQLTDQLLILAVPCLLVVGWLTMRMIPDEPAAAGAPAGGTKQGRGSVFQVAILVLGGIAFADMLCEGAAADWAAVFLRNSLHTAAAIAGLGYAVYCLAMVAVRLSGNRLLARFTAQRMLPALSGIATAGFATGLAVDSTVSMLIGFACLGAGLASVIPAVFSAAGRVRGINAGSAVAIVSACGWAGFVCGPPLIGQLAAASSLRLALALLPVLTALIAGSTATAKAIREDKTLRFR